MIIFQPTRTRRMAVRLKELTLGQSIALCKLPAARHEANISEFLRFVAQAEKPTAAYLDNPLLWSVEERLLLVTKYLATVGDDGPDFAIGDAHLSDYVAFDEDLTKAQADLGQVAGKQCVMVPLSGIAAQTLELLCRTRGDWIIGAIACQVLVGGEAEPDLIGMGDVKAMSWISERMDRIKNLPESAFSEIYAAYWSGADGLHHFFNVDFDDQGVIVQPIEKEGSGSFGPARFPPHTAHPQSRAALLDDLRNQVADLALHGSTALPLAHDTPRSAVEDFYRSSAFASYRKAQEGRQKIATAYIGRMDGMLKSIGMLSKMLSKRR